MGVFDFVPPTGKKYRSVQESRLVTILLMVSIEDAKAKITIAAAVGESNGVDHGLMFHYTNAEGLYGILKSRCLWATEFRSLGDTSEYIYGQKLIHDVLVDRNDHLSNLLHIMWPESMKSFSAVTLYVASGCQEGDLLSQWRGYARVNDGYSIALSIAALSKKSQWNLSKVVYSRECQVLTIKRILDTWQTVKDEIPATEDGELFKHGLISLLNVVVGFKDASFSGEHEWRLFRHTPPDETIKFRVARGHILPYTEIPLEEGDIRFVTQGPGNFRVANRRAVHDLGHKCGFGHLEVLESIVSLA